MLSWLQRHTSDFIWVNPIKPNTPLFDLWCSLKANRAGSSENSTCQHTTVVLPNRVLQASEYLTLPLPAHDDTSNRKKWTGQTSSPLREKHIRTGCDEHSSMISTSTGESNILVKWSNDVITEDGLSLEVHYCWGPWLRRQTWPLCSALS